MFEATLTQSLPSNNYPYVLHVEGEFENVVIGSVPKQEKPYPKIEEIIENSLVVETGKIQADMVGFYSPNFMFPIKGKGLHLHCLEKEKRFGGHVLDLSLKKVTLKFERLVNINVELPEDTAYQNALLSQYQLQEHVPVFSDRVAK